MARRARLRSPRRSRGTVSAAVVLGGAALFGIYALSRTDVPSVAEGRIPHVAYEAYVAASDAAGTVAPGCDVDWSVVAGIAQVESRHGRLDGGTVEPNGDVRPPIRGAALDGSNGTVAVEDTDGGELDGDASWDRAMGPLQFIPTTWAELARDGNGDGVVSADNLFDAAITAVAHLCSRSPGDYTQLGPLREALLAYNASGRYADQVLSWIERYRTEPLAEVLESPPPDAGRPGSGL
jgi:membrane-bound lytic murein transglycosylase B